MTTDITELAQLRAELSNPAVGSRDHLRKLALSLVEALELKEEQRANWFQMAQKLGEDLDAAEKRIADLESRTVTVRFPPRKNATDYVDGDFSNEDLAAIFNTCRLQCKVALERALLAAGIKWEAE
ncbi:TPA: hypothetical protein ACT19U_004639 [Raoultella ornithinolytica]